ncbi:RagB/SusD family nutrient uptake outer membrane protein [Sphingobacterium sp. SRCM116780]|uniref:RagB/SusD family nutrient uptake outer membrane protein n=1 Tax=Sphingobacterium sp. SRCM116780 TaxID=2907623 RepID=UPI001F3F0999|nr:RagB/SusD family nutrient uptake outer membrane protein [Sphingobacterium sp. SRCM116780]UIR56089.1 RagB/SusD family nutrient uptake outer membrane protein [Sphingobacterium sp. SRCM116780]
MKFTKKIVFLALGAALVLSSCNKDVLDRNQLTSLEDEKGWGNELALRLYANGFYPNYFTGYNTGFATAFAPVTGYNFSDDLTKKNIQDNFENSVPTSRKNQYSSTIALMETPDMLRQYSGPTWSFTYVRRANIFIDRIENKTKPNINDETYRHWTAVARFFRGFEYSRLVEVFGDVPYFDKELKDTDVELMYKDRDSRAVVMDHVYDDFQYVLDNMRANDGKQYLNKYVAASFISRLMLFEGSYLYYHNLDKDRAKKYLEMAQKAAEVVMNSGSYSFTSDFKSLFASEDLSSNKEVILYRAYDSGKSATHSVGSYSNGTEGQGNAANLMLVKSFICNDGQPFQSSSVANANSFSLKDLALTRDPRFEATFYEKPLTSSSTLFYAFKFASREALSYLGKTYPAAWSSNTNTSDAPVIRLAEVVLNWIEAKQILVEGFGAAAVTQGDVDKSINAIRNRPLDAVATAKGVKKTAPLMLGAIANDPARDADVSALMWEIRRERRMEFVFEGLRLLDIKRWKKLNYMDFSKNNDYFLGPWINAAQDIPALLNASKKNLLKVVDANGNTITYDGTNGDQIVGFYRVEDVQNREPFTDRSYMSPVGLEQVNEYSAKGYKLSQTKGW